VRRRRPHRQANLIPRRRTDRRQIPLASGETNEVIKSRSFTIDFKTRRLHFGLQQQLEHTVPLESPNSRIIVVAMIQGHPLRLSVDTGTYATVLLKESQMGWRNARVMLQRVRKPCELLG